MSCVANVPAIADDNSKSESVSARTNCGKYVHEAVKSLSGDVCAMELQCVVVYTIIDIPEPKPPPDSGPESSDGCLSWIKSQIKRWTLFRRDVYPLVYLTYTNRENFAVTYTSSNSKFALKLVIYFRRNRLHFLLIEQSLLISVYETHSDLLCLAKTFDQFGRNKTAFYRVCKYRVLHFRRFRRKNSLKKWLFLSIMVIIGSK